MSKRQKKEQQQKALGFPVDGHIPMVLVPEMDQEILEVIDQIIEGIASLGIQLVVVQPRQKAAREHCERWKQRHPQHVQMIKNLELDQPAYDLLITHDLSDKDRELISTQHIVPIAESGIVPFDPIAEKGNGFLFVEGDAWSLYAALVRATETYRFPYDWQNLVKSASKISAKA